MSENENNLKELPVKAKDGATKDNKLGVEAVNRQHSRKEGILGFLENLARHFQTLAFMVFIFPLIFLYALALGVAFFPGTYVMLSIWQNHQSDSMGLLAFKLALGAGVGGIGFIAGLMVSVAVINLPFLPLVKVYRGPWFSLDSIPWLYHNALFYLVRYTVLDFVTPTPLSQWFLLRMVDPPI